MSLWARLTKPSISKEEAEEKYYFTTSTGQIVSPEGSGYVIPALVPDVVEKQDYIPLDFAQQKVKDVTDEANRLREAYQKHLAELDSFYRQASTDSKAHYEGLIKDLKAKASRHVEIRKQMQAVAEEKLRGELKASEDSVEELRDSMASLNREYQEEVRSLKTTIGEGIKKTDDLTKEVTTLRDNADKVEAAVDLKHNTSNETRAACRDTLLSICQTIEIQQMKEDIFHLENTNAEVAALQAEVLAANEKNRQCHLQLKQAEQDRIEAAELQEQSAQYLIAVRNEHTEQLHALALAHRVKMLEARREYMTQLDRLYSRLHRSDVQNVVSEMCTTIAQQDANDALTQLNSNQQQNSLQYANQERALIQKFEQQLQTQREEFKTESDSLKKKFNHKMGQASARIRTAEVNVVLRDLVTQVVEQNTVAGSAAVAGAVMFGAAGQSETTAVPTTEHQALLLKVQQLEEQIVQNQQAFEQQLQQQKQASPRGGAAVVTTTGPTAAELAAQNELSEKLALLRSQEANLSEQLTTVSNKLAQYNTDLEKINHDKEECKNDIKEWSRAFLEANGREPNVQDKATVKDKYQRYKMLGAKAKEIEGKVGGYMGDEDEVSESLADIQAQIATLIGAVAVGAAAMAGAATTTTGAAVGAAAGAGAAGASAAGGVGGVGIVPVPVPLMVPQGPRAETVDASIQTEDRTAMLRKLNSQANLLTTASTKLQTSTKGLSDAAKAERRILELEMTVEQDILTMEGLDDQIYTLNSTISTLQGEKNAIEQERALLTSQIDSLIHEKRTDVVLQYQTEIQGLHAAQSALNEKIAHLTAEKMKHEAKINELSSRTEAAEMELKARDAAELAQLSTAEEKALLKTQIAKQRDQITLKAKAATAGWDAAASSDERLDVEVEKAYKKGLQEERQAHIVEMHSLNGAIEIKENRITELLVSIAEMERKVLAADNKVVELNSQTEMLKLEVADTIQSLVSMSMGGGGGGGESQVDENGDVVIMPTPVELEQAREQLDTAQEELVVLMERVDRLQIDLDVARRKNRVYEQLVNVTGIGNAETAMQKARTKGSVGAGGFAGGAAGGGGNKGTGDVNEIISIIKKAIAKGTNMWKSNRKDECYDVYNDACVECHDKLITTELKTPLNDAITTGKSMAIQNKQRAVVVVRKALDKLLADLEKPAVRKSEEDAGAFQRTQATELQEQHDTEHNEEVSELVSELNEIENNYLEQGYTKENNPSNTSQSPRGEPSADNNNNPSSLLARAKTAEAQVVTLKKQLAAVIAATASNNASGGASSKHNTGAAAAGLVAGAAVAGAGNRRGGANTGADPAEVRKLNRKIKELETQLKNNTGGGGGGGGGGDNKALLQQEKALNKKIKDMETQYKRDSKATEMRATKAENALSKIEATYNSVVSERDRLRNENQKLAGLPAELAVLKSKTVYFEQVEANLETKNKEYDTLAEQFKKETTLRKKYKNELEDLKGAIRVYARCRPMAKYEIERGCKSVVELKDDTSLKLVTQRGEKEFEFDAVFGDNSTQDQVFEDTKRLVESCMDGFNVCLFAYGQTGSGKTFTMTGSPSMPGLTPKAIDELFRHIDERPHCNVRVTTYFVELYNDNLVDLYFVLDNKNKPGIAEPPKLDIKMDAKKMVYIRNAVIKEANSPSELMDLFNSGNLERHTGATKMNAESSRSHSIFAIMVDSYDTATKRSTTGKLSLVDLAGSERADKTGAAAERLKEAQNINKSLSALGDVIAALSEGTKFIPYRNNKLTQLMQDSLGGNAKTLMFVNFSPADYNSDETSTSLMYAARVKKIVNNASKAAESEEVAKLKAIIKRLQAGLPVEVQAAVEEEDEGPPPADDPNKVYDGY